MGENKDWAAYRLINVCRYFDVLPALEVRLGQAELHALLPGLHLATLTDLQRRREINQ